MYCLDKYLLQQNVVFSSRMMYVNGLVIIGCTTNSVKLMPILTMLLVVSSSLMLAGCWFVSTLMLKKKERQLTCLTLKLIHSSGSRKSKYGYWNILLLHF